MTRLTTLLLALALAAPVAAQDTTATGDAAAETTQDDAATESEAPATDTTEAPQGEEKSALDMGVDPDAQPGDGVGQAYTKEEIGDWQLQCVNTENGEDPCQLYQLVRDEDGNPVAEFSLFRLPEGSQAVAGATIVVPLETALTEDLLLGVDGSKGKRYRFSFCSPIGCFARIGLTQADIDAMKRGKEANMTIVPWQAPDVKVRLNMSLIGFTEGLTKATQIAPPQQ
ncbi:invasion associated locus B family protein [Pseudooceanicola sp. LIPI14-2-Ac024]|uniref:invasion associated locus B family protein n=1 Tax=Pseudooceanicola sp. LIPI14-2-Ac024 TaxID=3344875 RepID=UPI0035D0F57D